MTLAQATEIFEKSCDNADSFYDDVKVISIPSIKIILNEMYECFNKQLEMLQIKRCCTCKFYVYKHCKNENSIAFNSDNAVYEDDYCKDHEPKDK